MSGHTCSGGALGLGGQDVCVWEQQKGGLYGWELIVAREGRTGLVQGSGWTVQPALESASAVAYLWDFGQESPAPSSVNSSGKLSEDVSCGN